MSYLGFVSLMDLVWKIFSFSCLYTYVSVVSQKLSMKDILFAQFSNIWWWPY